MKAVLFLYLSLLVPQAIFAQRDSSDLEKMGNVVAAAYRTTNPSEDLIERLEQSYSSLLREDASPVHSMIAAIAYKRNLGPDSAVKIFMDSSLAMFKRQHLSQEEADLKRKIQPAMKAYTGVVCACLTERTKASGQMIDTAVSQACVSLAINDTAVLQALRRIISSITPAERTKLGNIVYQSLFADCKPFYDLVAYTVKISIVGEYVFRERSRFNRFVESIVPLRASNDSTLSVVFPSWKRYMAGLDAMVKEEKRSPVYLHEYKKEEKAGVTRRSAYAFRYSDEEDPELVGEVIYSVNRYPVYGMLTYQFKPVSKMKNAGVVKKILVDEVPPPPPPGFLEIIDKDSLPPPPPRMNKKE